MVILRLRITHFISNLHPLQLKIEIFQKCDHDGDYDYFCAHIVIKLLIVFLEEQNMILNHKQKKKGRVRKPFCTTWQNTQPLSPMHESCPEEVVARLLEHEVLTALPKANFNLF